MQEMNNLGKQAYQNVQNVPERKGMGNMVNNKTCVKYTGVLRGG